MFSRARTGEEVDWMAVSWFRGEQASNREMSTRGMILAKAIMVVLISV